MIILAHKIPEIVSLSVVGKIVVFKLTQNFGGSKVLPFDSSCVLHPVVSCAPEEVTRTNEDSQRRPRESDIVVSMTFCFRQPLVFPWRSREVESSCTYHVAKCLDLISLS